MLNRSIRKLAGSALFKIVVFAFLRTETSHAFFLHLLSKLLSVFLGQLAPLLQERNYRLSLRLRIAASYKIYNRWIVMAELVRQPFFSCARIGSHGTYLDFTLAEFKFLR